MKLTFKGKTAIVTGASGGMGIECVKKLNDAGLIVLMLDLKDPPASFLKKYNKAVFKKKIDVTYASKLIKIINEFYAENKSIDYLVNATGVLWFDKDISATQIDFNVWDRVFEINLKSMAYLSKSIIPKMKKNKFGSMVHISSIDALSGDNKPQDAYGASKAAMIRLSKSLAIQFASYNVRSNIILPGPIETPMQNRWKNNLKAKNNYQK